MKPFNDCEGAGLSRFEGELKASAYAPLSVEEVVAILNGNTAATDHRRQEAIACVLSASDGWKDAVKSLGGAFASESATARLRDEKAG
jgi:hypothetical protein